jgi:hypothetical protein
MVSVPVELLLAPWALLADPPVALPTSVAELPLVPANTTQAAAVDPVTALAVRVTPLDRVKFPPAVAELALSFLTVPTVVATLTVMAKLLECKTSALVKVDQTSAAVPLGVVAHTSVALMLPAFLAK